MAASSTDGSQIVFLATHDGKSIRFEEEDVRSMGRQAYGVRGMRLGKGDYIVGMAITPKAIAKTKRRWPARGEPRPFGHRARLRQAHRRGRISPAGTWWQGRHQREDHGAQWQSRLHHAGERRVGSNGHQPVRQDHPHRRQYHPRMRTLVPGRASAASGSRTTVWPLPRSFRQKRSSRTATAKAGCCCSRELAYKLKGVCDCRRLSKI